MRMKTMTFSMVVIVVITFFVMLGIYNISFAESENIGDWTWADDYSYASLNILDDKEFIVDSAYTEPTCNEDGYWTVEYYYNNSYYYAKEYAEGTARCNTLKLKDITYINDSELIFYWECEDCGSTYKSTTMDIDDSYIFNLIKIR